MSFLVLYLFLSFFGFVLRGSVRVVVFLLGSRLVGFMEVLSFEEVYVFSEGLVFFSFGTWVFLREFFFRLLFFGVFREVKDLFIRIFRGGGGRCFGFFCIL